MTNSTAPGWYYAQGDPLGTERFWDGSSWIEGPRQVGEAMPPAPIGNPAMPPAPIGNPQVLVRQEGSIANLALGLSIVGGLCTATGLLFTIGIPMAVLGAVLGFLERRAISKGRRNPANINKAIFAILIGSFVVLAFSVILFAIAVDAS